MWVDQAMISTGKEDMGEPATTHKQAAAACGHDPYAES